MEHYNLSAEEWFKIAAMFREKSKWNKIAMITVTGIVFIMMTAMIWLVTNTTFPRIAGIFISIGLTLLFTAPFFAVFMASENKRQKFLEESIAARRVNAFITPLYGKYQSRYGSHFVISKPAGLLQPKTVISPLSSAHYYAAKKGGYILMLQFGTKQRDRFGIAISVLQDYRVL